MAFILSEVPSDVAFVWSLQIAKVPLGVEMYEECQKIKEKYPEWFSDDPHEELPRKIKK